MLAGLLSHIGMRDGDSRELKGARGSTFTIARGLGARPGVHRAWVMAAELVETNRLWARRVAAIEPAWAEQLGAHLVRRSYGEARWDPQRAAAVTAETVTLYGLPIVSGRTVPVDRVDRPAGPGRCSSVSASSAASGRRTTRSSPATRPSATGSASSRRGCGAARLLDDEELIDFYDERLPADITSGRRFDTWWKGVAEPHLLDLTDDVLGRRVGFRRRRLPGHLARSGDLVLPLSYRFDPGGAARRRVGPRAADRAQPGDRRRVRLADPGHRRELVDIARCGRCPRTCGGT